MKLQSFAQVLAVSAIALGTIATMSGSSSAQTTTYFCDKSRDGVPTTYALNPTGQRIAVIRWKKDWGGRYSPEARCKEVSTRFQSAHEKGVLNYITTGIMKGQQVVCAASDYGGPCSKDQVLFTLRHNDNAGEVSEHLNNMGFRAAAPLVQDQDGSTQHYFDMNQFLREAPVEQ